MVRFSLFENLREEIAKTMSGLSPSCTEGLGWATAGVMGGKRPVMDAFGIGPIFFYFFRPARFASRAALQRTGNVGASVGLLTRYAHLTGRLLQAAYGEKGGLRGG